MGWLGEELPGAEQADRTPFAPRCMKDLVEERLFERRRDLFSELSVVFMDTTSLYFEGAGGETPDEGPARFYLRLLDDYRRHGPPEQEPTNVQLALK